MKSALRLLIATPLVLGAVAHAPAQDVPGDPVEAAGSPAELATYAAMIQERVERNWIHPPDMPEGLECVVLATQDREGWVTDVKMGRCNASEDIQKTMLVAVMRASPLPLPKNPEIFSTTLQLTFAPGRE